MELSAMDDFVLSALHISSVFASSGHVLTLAVPTTRRDIPLAIARSDIPEEHASHSYIFHSVEIGRVLVRVVQGTLAVELVSLSFNVSPIRFVFPAAVVPNPALAVYDGQVYLIAMTSVGTLFRLSVPCHPNGRLWHGSLPKDWCREWHIKKLGAAEPKLVHVHDAHDVAVALSTGGYLRLENKSNIYENVQWTETEWRSTNWYMSLIPAMSPTLDHPEEIVCMASASSPTDVSDLFSISRNRALRRWSVTKGCRSEIILDVSEDAEESSYSLLDSRPQKLLQVFTLSDGLGVDIDSEDPLYVMVFLPSPSSLASGGIFRIYDTERYQWNLIFSIHASIESVHCRLQDFVFKSGILYVLWEQQGESLLELARIPQDVFTNDSPTTSTSIHWTSTRLSYYSKVDQEGRNELLLQPGSLTNKFLQSILRPGLFSRTTLRTALQDYKKHYLALPGPHSAALLASFPTLSEDIAATVGSTVDLTQDAHKSVYLHSQYWNALRRDWEGFLARCTEIERSARWPVCLGLDEHGQAMVVERERLGLCVDDDIPMQLLRQLRSAMDVGPAHLILGISWQLRTRLPEPLVRRIETEIENILHEEYSFALVDVITASASKTLPADGLDDAFSWASQQLSLLDDFDSAVRGTLDVVTNLEKAVKQEEEEVEMIIPAEILGWTRGIAASYLTETIESRYEICLALSVLFFFIGDNLKQTNPALLAEVFAVIRGIAICRYLCRQTAGDPDGTKPASKGTSTADEVVTRLNGMHMSRGHSNPVPSYSLIHELLSEYGHPPGISSGVHHFLDRSGLLSNTMPAQVTRNEVTLCEKLRSKRYYESARYILSWLPRTPMVCYVLGRLWINVGREDEAASLLQGVSGSFCAGNLISSEDLESLDASLPNGRCRSDCEFYLHVADIFKGAGVVSYQVHFLRLALNVWQEGDISDEISQITWSSIIQGYIDLGLYEDAYCYIFSSPHVNQRQQYVSGLIYKMCENDALDRLLSMNFRGIVQEVESALSFKARNADALSRPNWSSVLYTWYTLRGDFRNAALTMYIRSRRLSDVKADPTMKLSILHEQREALGIALNALGIVESKSAFLTVPTYSTASPPSRKPKTRNYLPKEILTSGQRDIEIVMLSDLEKEYAHLTANMELLQRDPTSMRRDSHLSPWTTVSKLTQANLYDLAMHTAKTLSVDMTELFQRLTMNCLELSSTSDASLMSITSSDWLLTDKTSSWPGAPMDRAWRYLRECLERFDSAETDWSYSKAVLETLLSNDTLSVPPWLLQSIEEHHPEYLVRSCLCHGDVEEALERSLKLVQKSTSALGGASKQASYTWLSYTTIDAVLKSTEENISPRAQQLRQTLQTEISNRLVRLRKQVDALSTH